MIEIFTSYIYIYTNIHGDIVFRHKKELNFAICNNMAKLGG